MSAFWGIVRYEYRMSIRRWSVWLAFLLAAAPLLASLASFRAFGPAVSLWGLAGLLAMQMNLFMPLAGGIVIADRFVRDRQMDVRELLQATPVAHSTYVLGKYAGAVLAALTPALICCLVRLGALVLYGVPAAILWTGLLAFLGISVPAFLFVGAFSLACPEVLPVRVYQVLFAGYWFWGNFLNPQRVPTISQTLLTPSGRFVNGAFFNAGDMYSYHYTAGEAVLNLLLLFACAAMALLALERYLTWQERRA
jgi:ABC-type Na+ efflux pump permease subunit